MFLSVRSKEAYFRALETVGESSRPIGAWRLCRLLQKKGLILSKATAGRLLKSLEDNGHARTEGNVGRVITPRGQAVLQDWLDAQARRKSHTAFEESLTIRGRQHLIDALIARRAIESETAYLAAQNVTKQDLSRLERIIEEHEELLSAGWSGVDKDAEFHRALAEAGRNRVLISALDVIHHNPQIGQALEYIRSKVGSKMVEDHKRILVQIARRDKEGARRAMTRHIAGVIRDVDKYWAEIAKP
ncbi:MAG TPA: FCD domain-containing protein [Firmicutes bacterium]|nr:FCD domain-containing protein [Candidatus Fermentithermobacillaceae bacterium]